MKKTKEIEENITKDVRNLFGLKKWIDDTAIKGVRNPFRLEKEIDHNRVKDVRRNPFRLKKNKTDGNTVKNRRNPFSLKKENKAIKEIIIRDIRNFFEHEGGNYYKSARVDNFRSNNYIE